MPNIETKEPISTETRRTETYYGGTQTQAIQKFRSRGSITEAIAGAGAAVLSILGLADIYPGFMAAIATIALGVALLAHGSLASRSGQESAGGPSGFIAGGVGVVLGILSLLGIAPLVLMPIALIVYGLSLLVGAGGARELEGVAISSPRAQVVMGIGGALLGVLALVGVSPLVLTLVGLLAVGAWFVLGGSAVQSRVTHLFHH